MTPDDLRRLADDLRRLAEDLDRLARDSAPDPGREPPWWAADPSETRGDAP